MNVGPCEERVFRSINRAPDALAAPVWAAMQLGSLPAVYGVGAVLVRTGRPPTAAATVLVGTAVWGGVKLIKRRVGRGRPDAMLGDVTVRGDPQTGLGYPSGHAAVVAALAFVVPPADNTVLRAAAVVTAEAVGGARIYVGAHLPLDVAGGLAIGTICGLAARALLNTRP